MKRNSLIFLLSTLLLLGACASQPIPSSGTGPESVSVPVLPSWNDGPSRDGILDFVAAVTDPESVDFVPEAERIAVFDNDGTLWAEQPVYFQTYFLIDRARAMIQAYPELAEQDNMRMAAEGDLAGVMSLGDEALQQLFIDTHTGMSADDFSATVSYFMENARHPTTGKAFTDMVYQPMLELMDYLRAHGFDVFIVSGGGLSFMRPWTEQTYGIPPQNVVGTHFSSIYEDRGEGAKVYRTGVLAHWDDKAGKPVGIERFIGRAPLLAAGNSDGDYQMLRYTTDPPGRQLGLIIHHTDSEREWAYDRDSKIGRLSRGLDDAQANGWIVIDMARDWKQVFPDD